MGKLKGGISGLLHNNHFKLSDLFLLLWLIPGAFLCYETIQHYSKSNSFETIFNYPFLIVCFIFVSIFSCLYLFLELREKQQKIVYYVFYFALYIIMAQLITIFLTPDYLKIIVNGYSIESLFNFKIKCLYFFSFIYIALAFFAGVFLLPKRINNNKFFIYLIYLYYFLALCLFIHSLFVDDYIRYIKYLFTFSWSEAMTDFVPVGIFGTKNLYGLFVEIGLLLALLNYHLTKNKFNIIMSFIFFFHLLFTVCKAGIVCATISMLIFLTIFLYRSIKDRNKNRTIFLSSILGVVFLSLIVLLILFLTNETIRNTIIFMSNGATMLLRTDIWDYTIDIIKSTSIANGAGFGIYNSILLNTSNSIDGVGYTVTHNWLFALLGRGGLTFIAFYMVFIIYSGYLLFKVHKKNKSLALILFIIELCLFLHSIAEDFYHFVIMAIMVTAAFDNINKDSSLIVSK